MSLIALCRSWSKSDSLLVCNSETENLSILFFNKKLLLGKIFFEFIKSLLSCDQHLFCTTIGALSVLSIIAYWRSLALVVLILLVHKVVLRRYVGLVFTQADRLGASCHADGVSKLILKLTLRQFFHFSRLLCNELSSLKAALVLLL